MANRYYGVNVGGQAPADVVIQASSPGRDVTLNVSDANIARAGADSKQVILESIEAIRLAVEQDDY